MSSNQLPEEETPALLCCANCGKEGGDGTNKLKNCTACYLVKYCSVACQTSHRKQHKKECRERAAELKDEALFSQGHESLFGECPICMIPLPSDPTQSRVIMCCMKRICTGCILAALERGMHNICAFCREPAPCDNASALALVQKRVDAGDAYALYFLGEIYLHGQYELQKDESRAAELFRESANLGSLEAHCKLGLMYATGKGLRTNMTNAEYHCEIAAKGGHPDARTNLGRTEVINQNYGRALKHWMIAAKMGEESPLKGIQTLHSDGHATKDDYFRALIGYQQAAEEFKSDQRETANAYFQAQGGSF